MQLNRTLTQMFRAPALRQSADPDYAKFRAECKRLGVTYKRSRDGYLELSDGRVFPHYTWGESLDRLTRPEQDAE